MYLKILLFFVGVHLISARISTVKKWIPGANYDTAENWDPKRVPCESDRILFSKIFDEELYVSKNNILVREIILPRTGNIILEKDGLIQLTNDAIKYPDCPGGDVTFKENIEEPWMLSRNWMDVNAKELNSAIPHFERIPCENDDIILENNKSYTIKMPRHLQTVKSIDNLISKYTNEQWKTHIENSPLAYHEWEDAESPSVKINPRIDSKCQLKESCLCQKEQSIFELCENEKKYCPPTLCLQPVQPFKHCCKICGGLLFLEEDKDFNVGDLRKRIQKKINEWEIDGIDWHISAIAVNGPKLEIQIVVVEKFSYDGRSVELAKRLSKEFTKDVSGISMNLSGMSWDPSRSGGWEIVIMFFVMGLFFTGLLLYYYSPSAIITTNPFRPLGFARFENRSREGSLMLAVSQLSLNKAFDNPMYDKATTPSDENTEFKEEPLNDSDTEEEHVSHVSEESNKS